MGLLGRKAAPATEERAGAGRGRGISVNAGARAGLALAQLLTIIAAIVVIGGLSALQKQANRLTTPPALLAGAVTPQAQAAAAAAYQQIYNEEFQNGNVIPYPGNGRYQFGRQWWILMFEIAIFITVAALLVFPRLLLRLKHIAMAFLVYVFVFVTLDIDSLLYFKRSATASSVYGSHRIKATLAGAILAAIANGLSIIFLGLLRETDHTEGGHLGAGKRVGADYGVGSGHGTGGANATAGKMPGGVGHREGEVVLPSTAGPHAV